MPPLIALLRALPGRPEAVRRAVAGVDPTALVDSAVRHALAPLVRAELDRAGVDLPTAPSDELDAKAMAYSAMSLRAKTLLFRSLDALAARGLVPVLLKGYALASRLYPDPLLRASGDVDLLVGRADLAEAEAAMASLGLDTDRGPAEQYGREHHHSVNFFGVEGQVELHFILMASMSGQLEADRFLARARPGVLEGRPVRYLAPEDEFIYLAGHAAMHLFIRLTWLYDLKLFVEREVVDWEQVVARARESGLAGPVYFALEAARRSVWAKVPADVLEALRPSELRAQAVAALFSEERLESAQIPSGRVSRHLAAPLLASDLGQMTEYSLHHLWRGTRRKLALRFPAVTPGHWRG